MKSSVTLHTKCSIMIDYKSKGLGIFFSAVVLLLAVIVGRFRGLAVS